MIGPNIKIPNVVRSAATASRAVKILPATDIGPTYFTANFERYPNAYYYEIDLSKFADFSTFVYNSLEFVVINNKFSYQFRNLDVDTTYYYRIRAIVDDQFKDFYDNYNVSNSYSEINTTSNTRSDVFKDFSLLGYPTAIAEDVIYTQIPENESGNLVFTRASEGTRVTKEGLVGDVPWNKVKSSNDFNDTAFWNSNTNITKVPSQIQNPLDKRLDGWKVEATANGFFSFYSAIPATNFSIQGYSQTESIFVKAGTCKFLLLRDGQVTAQEAFFNIETGTLVSSNIGTRWFIEDYGNGWYRVGKTALGLNVGMRIEFFGDAAFGPCVAGQFCYIYGYQWAESAIDTPLPYIQTTDRLDVPRLDWKNNQPGILMEGQRTNLIRFSQDLNVTGGIWSPNAGGTITANVATAPDGTESADRLTCNNNTYSGWYQAYTAGRVVNSIYAKYENTRYLSAVDPSGGANAASFDLINGAVAYTRSNVLAYIENAGNGWYRCVWWENSNGSSYSLIQLWLDSTPGANGGVSGSCLLWGAQVEPMENISNRTYASSYIRTFATSVTRLSDVASTATIPTLIGQTEGSVFVDFEFTRFRNSGIFNLASAQSPNWAHSTYAFQASNGIWIQIYSNGALQGTLTAYGMADKSRKKLLFVYKQNDFRFYLNGVLVASQTTGVPSLNMQRVDLFSDGGSVADIDRPFSKLYSYGLIKRALTNAEAIEITDIGIDPDAQAFFDRVTAAGGSLSNTEKIAVNQLVLDMKSYGIWTKMKAIYPMVGASAAACSQNLKSSSFTGTFTATGWTFASTGVTPNGTSAYFNTGLNASNNLSVTSLSFGGYTSTTSNGNGYNGAYPPSFLMMSFKSYYLSEFYRTDGTAISISGGVLGMVQANQLSTTSKIFANNSTGASGTITMTSLPNQNMYIGAANNNGSSTYYDNKLISYYYYSDGLTDDELLDHYTAVQVFQTTLSRNV